MTEASEKAQRGALAMLIFGACVIAFAGIFMRWSLLPPSVTAFWRVFLALPILGAALLRPGVLSQRAPSGRRTWPWLLLPGVFFSFDLALWHWSMNLTTVSNSTLLANCAPIWVTVVAIFLFKEHITRRFLTGLCLALGGMILLSWGNLYLSRETLLGDALALAAALFYGSYQLSVRYVRRYYSAMAVMAGSSVTSSVLLFLIATCFGEAFFIGGEPWWRVWLPLLGLALAVHVLGQGSIAYALAYLPSSFSSVTLMLQPVLTAVLGWVLLGEAIGAWQGLGGIVILSGILLARQGSVGAATPGNAKHEEVS